MGDWARRRARRPIAVLILFVVSSGAVTATAQDPGQVKPQPTAAATGDRRTIRRLPANFIHGSVGVFDKDNLVPLVAGGVATGGAWALDAEMRDAINPDPGQGWGKSLKVVGGPVWSSAFVASMFTAGRVFKNERFKAMTYDLLDAAVVDVVYSQAFKLVASRERPNGSNDQSFPSAHTSNAFAIAAVAERHYGWKIGIPAYALAATVGASRMKEDAHYFSDVVAGATLGYIIGRTVVRVNNKPLAPEAPRGVSLNVAPIVARSARGLRMSLTF